MKKNIIARYQDNCANCKHNDKSVYAPNCDKCLYDVYKKYHHKTLENIATKYVVNKELNKLKTEKFFILNIFYNILLNEYDIHSATDWIDRIKEKIDTTTLTILKTKMNDMEKLLFKKEYDYFFGKNSVFQKLENDIKKLGIISIDGIIPSNHQTKLINTLKTR